MSETQPPHDWPGWTAEPNVSIPVAPPPAPVRRPSPWAGRWAFALYGGVAGLLLGSLFAGGSGDEPAAAPAPTVTVTQTAPAKAAPTQAATTEAPAPATYKPRKSDWNVAVRVTKKECFDTAGCNVEVSIDPQYVGTDPLPDSGTIEVTYEVRADEDPVVDTFTVDGGQVSYTKTESLSTKHSGSKVKAKVTDVTYDGN